ncbi:VOC family protein [Arcticibacterium luteifluviistationis]|uniref:Glyoxalase n=1 Tax=Arcticibacterium luteifluviistationis TaxID=1784714 RepID=A0A2Z4GB57_9BACT|nr:VOC family protein [Arcticibacterium luteifluviistationis]AWV98270.1 glyoxalase [Arcticibacterium luteifluviistationis]
MRRLEFTSLQVTDLEVSKAFYTEKLGFKVSEMKNPDAVVFSFNKGEASFAIRKPFGSLANKDLGVGVSTWFAIDEKIEELQASLQEKKVNILGEIMDTPFGKALHILDPDGYKLTFLELK